MTSRKAIYLSVVPLLLAAAAMPVAADSASKTKRLPADQAAQRSTAVLPGANAALNSDSELQMIQLQSTMSQRQNAIQMTTNMLNAMNQSQKNIAKNIDGGCSPNC